MQDTAQGTTGAPKNQEDKIVSPFEEIKEMNLVKATNILLSAANAAQRAGALSVRDAVLLASAGEYITKYVNQTAKESSK
jgi:hypothetical protein